ncbi:MAG: DUF2793 domain-containing protein [Allosphingosinicella sp.]|uniref:DUF2793 domain-containing protein n=1 Tax=Allosphingosinicella sp. TaxID=2823234 RepID=UPI00395492B6
MAAGATGQWAGQDDRIAGWTAGGWVFPRAAAGHSSLGRPRACGYIGTLPDGAMAA